MQTTAVHQNFYSVYQTLKAYKETDQIKKYTQYCGSHFWIPTNTKTDAPSKRDAQDPYGALTYKANYALERMWQPKLASGLESLACNLQGQGKRLRKFLKNLFSMCSFQKLYQNL